MLGRLLERRQPGEVQRPDRPTLSAFLVMSANAPVLEGVWQVHPYFGMGEALANGSIWFVFAAFDSDAAPST